MFSPGPGIWPIVRKHTRFMIDLRLVVKVAGATLHGRTSNISGGGLGATVAGDIPLGTEVRLEFQLPVEKSGEIENIAVNCVVRYRQGFQYGFEFTNLSQQQFEMVERATRYLPLAPIVAYKIASET